jgi:cytochrome c oxidase cbb3-type subunit 3
VYWHRTSHSNSTENRHLPWAPMAAVAAVVWLSSLSGCGHRQPGNQSKASQEASHFTMLFGDRCSGCHGADGTLGPAPPLNDPLFLAIVPEHVMKDVVRHGREGTLMTAFGTGGWNSLREEQIDGLVSGIRSAWGADDQAPAHAPPYPRPDSPDDVASDIPAGKKVFGEVCASCHGEDGCGGTAAGAIGSPDFLSLVSDQMLRRIVITGRPDLGMPDYRELGTLRSSGNPLTSEEVADIVVLLASWREADDQSEKTLVEEGGNRK